MARRGVDGGWPGTLLQEAPRWLRRLQQPGVLSHLVWIADNTLSQPLLARSAALLVSLAQSRGDMAGALLRAGAARVAAGLLQGAADALAAAERAQQGAEEDGWADVGAADAGEGAVHVEAVDAALRLLEHLAAAAAAAAAGAAAAAAESPAAGGGAAAGEQDGAAAGEAGAAGGQQGADAAAPGEAAGAAAARGDLLELVPELGPALLALLRARASPLQVRRPPQRAASMRRSARPATSALPREPTPARPGPGVCCRWREGC
jgi:hypothetical protein